MAETEKPLGNEDERMAEYEEFLVRYRAFREEKEKRLEQMRAKKEIPPYIKNLPQKEMEKLMDKHGLTNWFDDSVDESS